MKRWARIWLWALTAALAWTPAAWAADFSADLYEQSGQSLRQGRLFVKGRWVRIQFGREVILLRPDKKVMWVMDLGSRTYRQAPFEPGIGAARFSAVEVVRRGKLIGHQDIEGRTCQVYALKELGGWSYFWIWLKSPFPLRMEDNHNLLEARNIRMAPQPKEIFQLLPGMKLQVTPAKTPPGPTKRQ